MAYPRKSKLLIITASLAMLLSLQVVFTGMISGGTDLDGTELFENHAVDSGTNICGEDSSDHAAFCQSQHCVNCFVTVVTPFTIIDHNLEFVAPYQRNMWLQINSQPRIKPPRPS